MQRVLLLVPTATYRAAAFVQAARRLDTDVTVASEKPNALAEYAPVDLLTLDFSTPDRAAVQAREFASHHPVDAVVGVDDQVALSASAVAAALSLPHNPIDAAYACLNKHNMRKRLAAARVSQPEFQLAGLDEDPVSLARGVPYPCVLKPLMMAASRGVMRANTSGEFIDAFRRIEGIVRAPDAPGDEQARQSILVEEYVPGWEIALDGMLTDGRLEIVAIFDKPDTPEGPYFPETIYVTPSRLPDVVSERLLQLTQDAVTALGLQQGPIHAEIRGKDDRLWFIEVAARSIGGYCSKVIRFADGQSLEDVILGHALGRVSRLPQREPAAAGVLMLQAPRSGRFEEARGLEDVLALPGIEEVIISAHRGETLEPLPQGFLYAGFVFSRAATPQAVESSLSKAQSLLDFVIEPL